MKEALKNLGRETRLRVRKKLREGLTPLFFELWEALATKDRETWFKRLEVSSPSLTAAFLADQKRQFRELVDAYRVAFGSAWGDRFGPPSRVLDLATRLALL